MSDVIIKLSSLCEAAILLLLCVLVLNGFKPRRFLELNALLVQSGELWQPVIFPGAQGPIAYPAGFCWRLAGMRGRRLHVVLLVDEAIRIKQAFRVEGAEHHWK